MTNAVKSIRIEAQRDFSTPTRMHFRAGEVFRVACADLENEQLRNVRAYHFTGSWVWVEKTSIGLRIFDGSICGVAVREISSTEG